MEHSPKKLRPPGKIHGGKCYQARRIIELFPEVDKIRKYVEPCGGLASVLLNLPAATREQPRIDIYNDIDGRYTNFFSCLRNCPDEMTRALSLTPYSELELQRALDADAYNQLPTSLDGCVERARRLFVLMQMTFSGHQQSFSRSKARTRRGIADVVSGYLSTIHDELPEIIPRVLEWQIENRDIVTCMDHHGGPDTLFYIDPPYHPDCRSRGAVYQHEMSHEDHVRLLDQALVTEGKLAISHYAHKLYDERLKDWNRHEIEIANHAAGGKTKRRMVECIWRNY